MTSWLCMRMYYSRHCRKVKQKKNHVETWKVKWAERSVSGAVEEKWPLVGFMTGNAWERPEKLWYTQCKSYFIEFDGWQRPNAQSDAKVRVVRRNISERWRITFFIAYFVRRWKGTGFALRQSRAHHFMCNSYSGLFIHKYVSSWMVYFS